MTLQVIDKEIKDTNIRILKTSTCPSLSGRSKLNYSIGCTEQKEILIRVLKSSGGGKLNTSYHSLDTIIDLIDKAEKPFNWSALEPIFKGQSVNTAGFVMAVLKKEGLVQSVDDGGYERTTKNIKSLLIKQRSRRAAK